MNTEAPAQTYLDYNANQLVAGCHCFTGFRKNRIEPLKQWLLWHVEEHDSELWLVSVIEPADRVALTPELAREISRIELSAQFSCERFPDFYELAHAFGLEVWASEQPFYGIIHLNARSYLNSNECWVSVTRSSYTQYSATEALEILQELVFEVVKKVVLL